MAKKISRRSFLKRIFGFLLTGAAAGSGGYVYARKIEPRLLDITHHSIKQKNLPPGFHGVKIVQFSDTHLGFQYDLHQLEEAIEEINKQNPDIVFFTGDLFDHPKNYPFAKKVPPLLQGLNAPLGKFSVYGNHDHGGYGSDLYKKTMEQSGFTLLLNESKAIKLLDGSSMWIAGIDDAMLGRPDMAKAMANIPQSGFTILLSHAPDLANDAVSYSIQLQLSGHSHGGQVKVPFYGPLITPPFAEVYREGMYTVGNSEALKLYVNRGLGTTRMPFRFLSKPELSVFTLLKD